MMGVKDITVPSKTVFESDGVTGEFEFDSSFGKRINGSMKEKQKIIDSEVLRLCSPMVPFRTGALEKSGTLHTVIGSGEVKYSTPYARRQYYKTGTSRSYDANRGGMWFERMKTKHKAAILRMLKG